MTLSIWIRRAAVLTLALGLTVTAFAQDSTAEPTADVTPEATMSMADLPDRVTVVRDGLFPEGVEWDPINETFLVGSVTSSVIHRIADDETLTELVNDDRIPVSVGIEVDEDGERLLVAATDMSMTGFLGIYDLNTGESLAWVDLAALLPNDEHFINDIAVDAAGNAYVTDSLAGVIYRVDPSGAASVFLEDDSFSTNFALNGIDYLESQNALIAVRVPGLIVIPLDNPTAFTTVEIDEAFVGADGVTLIDDSTLVLVNNNPAGVYRLETEDGFATATVTGEFDPGPVFPTTAAVRDGEAYVVYAQLSAQDEPISEFPIQRVEFE